MPDGDLRFYVTISHAKLVQIIESVEPGTSIAPTTMAAPTHLHYLKIVDHTAGFVDGIGVNALCGVWFVPSQTDGAELPVCPECDRRQPVAQGILDLLRAQFQS